MSLYLIFVYMWYVIEVLVLWCVVFVKGEGVVFKLVVWMLKGVIICNLRVCVCMGGACFG